MLDVKDTEHIWCTATVELKIQTENREPLLYLHYSGWSRKYDEYMYQSSSRIAPLGFYTSRKDIPRYKMSANSPMLFGHVMENGMQQIRQNLDEEDQDAAAAAMAPPANQ